LDTILNFIQKVGTLEGLLTIIVLWLHRWLFKMYNERLKDRQKEIDRMAKDIHTWRDDFWKMVNQRREDTKTIRDQLNDRIEDITKERDNALEELSKVKVQLKTKYNLNRE